MILRTKATELVDVLRKKKKASFGEIAREINWNEKAVEEIAKLLEKKGVIEIDYPANMLSKPTLSLKNAPEAEKEEKMEGKVLKSYKFTVDFVPVEARIIEEKEEGRPIYFIEMPKPCASTALCLDVIKEEIARKIPIETEEISDKKKNTVLKERFFRIVKKELEHYFPSVKEEIISQLAGIMLHSMYGLGETELLMGDNLLEEIAINSSKTPLTVYHREYGWMKSNILLNSEEDIFNYAAQIGRKVGREITTLNPILDAHLITGDRVNATLSPISSQGNTITIRRFSRKPWTITDFIDPKRNTMDKEMAALLWIAIQYEMNVIVAGSTASGKTSCLNTLCAMIPSYHRILTIEDVRELALPEYLEWNWVPLTTRNPNPEGSGEVTMFDLMMSSLRMRPDRIILGEIRKKKEAEVLFEAMHTGHAVYSTMHADSATQVVRRLLEPPIEVPPLEVEALHLVLVQYRDRKTNRRRTYELSEIETGVSEKQLNVNTVYRWRPREDSWEKVGSPTKLMNELNLHTGMTEQEVMQELEERRNILDWMLKQKIFGINEVGKVMKLFYAEPETIKNAAMQNKELSKI